MMLKKISIMLLGICLLCGCSTKEVQEVQTGELFQTLSTEEMQELFSQYDLTMVNIWATWCGPCVGEMPELSAMYDGLPENLNMITVCTDSFSELQTANEVLKNCNANFTTLHVNPDVTEYFLKDLTAFPTTLFVNRDGEIVGEAVIGARSAEQYMEEFLARLE